MKNLKVDGLEMGFLKVGLADNYTINSAAL